MLTKPVIICLSVLRPGPNIYKFGLPEIYPNRFTKYFWQRQSALLLENVTSSWSLSRQDLWGLPWRTNDCAVIVTAIERHIAHKLDYTAVTALADQFVMQKAGCKKRV